MKILVTGGGGFIGSHLCEALVKKGHQVKALIRYNSRNHHGWLEEAEVRDEIEFVIGDVRDVDSLMRGLEDCDGVFHLGALIGIPYSYISPLAYIRTNVEGTYNVLHAARERNLDEIIVTSTSEVYGTAQYVPINELHPLVAQSPYSASKIAADQLALSYFRSFQLPIKIVRPFNTYGPRQSARAIIPTIITQILNGQEEIALGNTAPTRDFIFVKDTAQGFIDIYESAELYGEVTNIGMGEEISVGDLAKTIARLMNKQISIIEDVKRIRSKTGEVERLLCDNTRLITNVGWTPCYNLEKGLKETITWFEQNFQKYKADIYNV